MLEIDFGSREQWDSDSNLFYTTPPDIRRFEHSLYSLSLWESKWRIPFFNGEEKTAEQTYDYINCMSLDGPVDPNLFLESDIRAIKEYIESSLTATTIRSEGGNSGGVVTSEVLYAQMAIAGVDWEAQYWHISRLTTLLQVIGSMRSEKKKKSRNEILKENARLNEERKKALGTKG